MVIINAKPNGHATSTRDGAGQSVTPLQRVLDRLEECGCSYKANGSDYMAQCPAHDDKHPSLSISKGKDGRVLLCCHAGCKAEDVVAALGLPMRDLFFGPGRRSTEDEGEEEGDDEDEEWSEEPVKRHIVAEYSYHDREGVLLYQALRYEPKDFRQRRPDGQGGWIWDMQGVQRVLYRLPQLLAANPAETVYITEGEKDADRLATLDLIATTNVGGAGKWRVEYGEDLRDRHIVILPDNDKVGREHADKVARALAGVAASVKIVALPGLPEKGDASDWLDNGGTPATLASLVDGTPVWKPHAGASGQASGERGPTPSPTTRYPDPPNEAVYYGLAGDITRALDPTTEADKVAVLVGLLAAVGNIIGGEPHWAVSGARHPCLLNYILVGDTSKGRKGTAWSATKPLLQRAAPDWYARCIASGLASGEGLIHAVRDPVEKEEPTYEGGRKGGIPIGHHTVITDAGVADKRLLVVEGEFAKVMKVMGREGNTLSTIIRDAWDGSNLTNLTKNNPERATNPHITIAGHITKAELLRHLTDTEAANGFANRFLWLCVRRSKLLPHGGQPDHESVEALAQRFGKMITVAQGIKRIERDDEANAMWEQVYGDLSDGGVGLVGAVLGRAEAQALRIAATYAVLDGSNLIRRPHLEAALALWDYVEASARYIFGEALGDPVADTILAALRAGPDGLTQTEISSLLGRNVPAARIGQALAALVAAGKVRHEARETGGRTATVWFAT